MKQHHYNNAYRFETTALLIIFHYEQLDNCPTFMPNSPRKFRLLSQITAATSLVSSFFELFTGLSVYRALQAFGMFVTV
jgi:hypothetical protein